MRPLHGAAPRTLEAMDGLQRGGCSPAWGLWILEGLSSDNPQGTCVVQDCGPGCSQGAHGQDCPVGSVLQSQPHSRLAEP